MSQRYIALDPGNSTGWVKRVDGNVIIGGTIGECHKDVWDLLETYNGTFDGVVYETFQMYPNKAQKLIWNTFYPCEVIGIIKLWCELHNVKIIPLQPSTKKYALGASESQLWQTVRVVSNEAPTEHMRDAVRLLRYAERNNM